MSESETAGVTDEGRDLDALLDDAIDAIASLEERLGEAETLEELSGDAVDSALEDLRDLLEVADELEDLFATLDLAELREAVDGEDLLEAIRVGEIPEALADRDEGLDDAVDVSKLIGALDLLDAWDGADLTELWQEADELGDEVDDLTDEDDEDDEFLGPDSRLTDEEGDVFDTDAEDLRGSFDIESDPELYQTFIQQQAMRGIDEFRDALLRVHGKFERLYEINREKMRMQDTSTNSRNPTAASTIPVDRRDLGGGARYSTVPRQVKYSTAPTRRRIYGRRFELERKRRGYE